MRVAMPYAVRHARTFRSYPRVGDDDARLLIGIDAGKVTTSLAWGRPGDDGSLTVEGTSAARHLGEPLAPFFALTGRSGRRGSRASWRRAPSATA